ncbi:unnamed protein product [Arabidopsis halleri]
MDYPAYFRFRPTDDVIIDYYLRLKHLGIEEGDVWDLPSKSKSKCNDNMICYFYSRDEYKFNEAIWKTSSGYWKETGSNTPIIGKWKRTNGVKIGEKKALVFQSCANPNGSKSDWVMHVYQPTFLPPDQRAYVVCKVEFKSEDKDTPGNSDCVIELNHPPIPCISQNGASSTTIFEVG